METKRLRGFLARLSPVFLLPAVALSGCFTDPDEVAGEKEGYQPVYMAQKEALQVTSLPAQPLRQTGKIYAKDTLVFVNELNKGFHVINNKNPRSPQNIAFVSIPGNMDIAVKGNSLYADNFTDLVVLDITNPRNITLVKRLAKALPQGIQDYPPYQNVFFECVDPSKGVVSGWKKTMLTNPKCRR